MGEHAHWSILRSRVAASCLLATACVLASACDGDRQTAQPDAEQAGPASTVPTPTNPTTGEPTAAAASGSDPSARGAASEPSPAQQNRIRRIDEAIAAVGKGADSAAQWAAVAALQGALRTCAESLAEHAEHEADDPELLAWQRGLRYLERLASAGWQIDPYRDATAARTLTRAATPETQPASEFESWVTAWLLRGRLNASSAALREVPLQELADLENLERYAQPGSEQALWCVVLVAMVQRGSGKTTDALRALDLADATLADAGEPGWPTLRVYSQLERASCHQRLGRAAAASRALAAAHEIVKSRSPGDTPAARQLQLETSAVVALARIRQACLDSRSSQALRRIEALRSQQPGAAIAAQLDYYEALARFASGDAPRGAECLDRALARRKLASRVRGLALLESAGRALRQQTAGNDASNRALARERLEEFGALESTQAGDAWPLLTARADALRARASRLEILAADESERSEPLVAALAAAERAYDVFLDAWRTADDGLGIGTLSFQPRRLLVDEVLELHVLQATGPLGIERALAAGLRARAGGALARSLGASTTPDLAAIRERVLDGDRDGMLVLLPGMDCTHAFLLTRTGIHHTRGASVEQLRTPVRALWRELASVPNSRGLAASSARAEAAASSLRDLLLPSAELRDALSALDRLCFVGSDLIERIPIEVIPQSDGRALGLSHAIRVAPSAAVALQLTKRRRVSARPRLTALLPPAPAGQSEVRFPAASKERLGGACSEVRWFEDDQATAERIVEMREGALLLFGHGIRDRSRARPRGVALAGSTALPDGGLYPADLERLDPSASPLVLLAVCEATGTDTRPGSDDSDHLAASFLRAGARTVFASACALEQGATAELAAACLEELGPDVDPAEALRRARVALRKIPRYDHPQFWGTWSVIGP